MSGRSRGRPECSDRIGYSDIGCGIGLAAGTSGVTTTRASAPNAWGGGLVQFSYRSSCCILHSTVYDAKQAVCHFRTS